LRGIFRCNAHSRVTDAIIISLLISWSADVKHAQSLFKRNSKAKIVNLMNREILEKEQVLEIILADK
jgi:hypothetical protein